MSILLKKNEPIMNWVYAGPFDQDVSELYFDNYIVPVEPYLDMIEQARGGMVEAASAVEGDKISLYGQSLPFQYMRSNEADKKATWASFGTYPHYIATYAVCDIELPDDLAVTFDLWATGTVFIAINQEEVLAHRQVGRVSNNFSFQAELKKGKNRCVVLLINVHLHSINSFALSLQDINCTVSAPLIATRERREDIEADLSELYLEKALLFPGDMPVLCSDRKLHFPGKYCWTLNSGGKRALKQSFEPLQGSLSVQEDSHILRMDGLPLGGLPPGVYSLRVDYREENSLVHGVNFSLTSLRYIENLPTAAYQQRKQFLVSHFAEMKVGGLRETNYVYIELAKLEAGRASTFDEDKVRLTLDYINNRYDCADFAMHGVLRLYIRYKDSEFLSDGLKQEIKDCILNFKYWVDEAGKSMMFTRSENHEILFYSAEYVAGLLFPRENFPNSEQNGLFHALKGRLASERWIKEKGRWGFTEWHSNTYYEEDILALLSIYDFGEENSYIRRMAKNLLDFICLLMASQNYQGILATTHGRCYEGTLMYPTTEPISRIMWLLYGSPKELIDAMSIGSVALAGSGYAPPAILEDVANSLQPLRTRTRMGMFASKGLGGVNCETLRTKDYMISGLVESCAGEHGAQVSAGQAILSGKVPVFVTCFDNKSETTRPSYWGGQYIVPKTIVHENLLAYVYKIDTPVGYTHCYFPMDSFDEVTQKSGWLFGRKNDAYIAVYSQNSYRIMNEGTYRRRELLCLEKKNIWLLQLGCKDEYGPFEEFIGMITKSPVVSRGDEISYTNPAGRLVTLGWDSICSVDGTPILKEDFPLIDNPFAQGSYGEGLIYSGCDKRIIYNFNI